MADAQSATPPDQAMAQTAKTTYDFNFSDFLRREYRFGLDPDRPQCKAYMQGHCPLGNRCPDKHQVSSSYNKYVHASAANIKALANKKTSLVCKHWLRGLCKKGEMCEFLHEYNLRRMPECSYYARTQTCSNGDDCLYLHIDPEAKRPPCPHYDRGFCPLGPHCALKHNKKANICLFYLAGFCPEGPACKHGAHPRFPSDLKKPEFRVEKTPEQLEQERLEREAEREREDREEREQQERNPHHTGGHKQGGRWNKGGRGRGGRGRRARGGF
jgi:cleavage and polyadenylation specificity factor subunit 4